MIRGLALNRILGFGSIGLALALAASAAFGWLQTERLGAARETIAARDEVIAAQVLRIEADAVLIAERDRLIGRQNDAVRAIQSAQAAERSAYQARLASAERTAGTYRAQAADILQRNIETQDELERSREALRLIVEVVGQEPPKP